MITAKEARMLTDKILAPVDTSPEFKEIMQHLGKKIREAAANGLKYITIKGYCLPVYNNHKYPNGINRKAIDKDTFWVPYVKKELELNGFKFCSTLTCNTYSVCW